MVFLENVDKNELVLLYARGVAKANKRQYVGKILYLVSRGNS